MDFCNCNCQTESQAEMGKALHVAMATVPMQMWETAYDGEKGLKQGTIFPCLDLPFYVTGGGIIG